MECSAGATDDQFGIHNDMTRRIFTILNQINQKFYCATSRLNNRLVDGGQLHIFKSSQWEIVKTNEGDVIWNA